MKLFLVNWTLRETQKEAGYRKSRQIVELVTLTVNLLSLTDCMEPPDFSDCVGNKKCFCQNHSSEEQIWHEYISIINMFLSKL